MGKNRLLDTSDPDLMKRPLVVAMILAFGSFTACVTLPRSAAVRDPLSAEEHIALGNAYLGQAQRQPAQEQYKMALAQNKRYMPALVALGNMAFEEQDWKTARDYFKRALKAAPTNAGVINNLAMVDLAEGKNLEEAIKSIDAALPDAGSLTPYLQDTRLRLEQAIQMKVKESDSGQRGGF